MSKIKVDVVSGFLGAGKTTLISKYAAYRIRSGERIAIIENEYGEAGIDGEILQKEGLSVYEIVNGCICCSLKSDIIFTMETLAQKKKVDRLLVEPTGIFMLDQIYEILKTPSLAPVYEVSSIVTVVDGKNFINHRKKYLYFFENQIRWSHRIIVSKTAGLEPGVLQEIIQVLQEMSDGLEVYTRDWSSLTGNELEKFFAPRKGEDLFHSCCCRQEGHKEHEGHKWQKGHDGHVGYEGHEELEGHYHREQGHAGFEGVSVGCSRTFSDEELKHVLIRVGSGEFGDIPRSKGFVQSSGQGFWEFHLVGKELEIKPLSACSGKLRASFIGMNIDRKALQGVF